MRFVPRHRTIFVIFAAILAVVLRTITDPDSGVFKTLSFLIALSEAFVVVALVHWARKAYLDYGRDTDMRVLFRISDPGRALIAIAIFFLAFAVIFASRAGAQDLRTYVPPQAHQFLPTLKGEVDRHFPEVPHDGYHAGLIEHESGCFALKKKCWNPRSELRTSREQGAGLGQITRAYRPDGSLRFDALQEMVDRYPQLRGWSWANVFDRPDLQLRAVVLKTREDFRFFARALASEAQTLISETSGRNLNDPRILTDREHQALLFADAAYNGGRAGVERERRACNLKPGCDPDRWTGHVEHLCMKSKAPLYGNRSACDINRHHVRNVLARSDKYLPWMS